MDGHRTPVLAIVSDLSIHAPFYGDSLFVVLVESVMVRSYSFCKPICRATPAHTWLLR